MIRSASLFSQLVAIIDRGRFHKLVVEHRAERHAKGFSCWDQFVAVNTSGCSSDGIGGACPVASPTSVPVAITIAIAISMTVFISSLFLKASIGYYGFIFLFVLRPYQLP